MLDPAPQGSVLSFPGPLGELSQFLHPHAGPIAPGQGFLPLGNLLTSDFGGPYNLSLLATQENEIKGARQSLLAVHKHEC